jgi:hypothetical protein
VTYINKAGLKVVAQIKLANGEKVPLIAADADLARLESMMPLPVTWQKPTNIKLHLRQVGRLLALEDPVNVTCRAFVLSNNVGCVAHQAA